jgi:hypothetical protein
VNGTPTYKAIRVKLIDASGDERSVRLQPIDPAATNTDLEAYVAALQALTNASASVVDVIDVYAGDLLASNALTDSYQSVYDNVVLLMKDASTQQSINAFVPAPLNTLVDDGDVVDTSLVAYQTWRDAVDTILTTAFAPISVRFTERREKNDSIPAS